MKLGDGHAAVCCTARELRVDFRFATGGEHGNRVRGTKKARASVSVSNSKRVEQAVRAESRVLRPKIDMYCCALSGCSSARAHGLWFFSVNTPEESPLSHSRSEVRRRHCASPRRDASKPLATAPSYGPVARLPIITANAPRLDRSMYSRSRKSGVHRAPGPARPKGVLLVEGPRPSCGQVRRYLRAHRVGTVSRLTLPQSSEGDTRRPRTLPRWEASLREPIAERVGGPGDGSLAGVRGPDLDGAALARVRTHG